VGTTDHGGILSVAGRLLATVEAVDGLIQCPVNAGGEQYVQRWRRRAEESVSLDVKRAFPFGVDGQR
jgi:hypothetical protein